MVLLKKTIGIRLWTFFKVPMIFLTFPVVHVLDRYRCEISMGLGFLSKNHHGSMYLGVLAAGADLVSGLLAYEVAKAEGKNVKIIFKDMNGSFLKRTEARAHFVCKDGDKLRQGLEESYLTGERRNIPVKVEVFCPSISEDLVAHFTMTVSIRA